MAGLAAPGHGVRPVLVEGEGVARNGLAQIVANMIEIEFWRSYDRSTGHVGWLDEDDGKTLTHDVAHRHGD